jgi:UDP-GlcNAc:undecaprenyl-phosphate GlcNAc-1-phosphate transferase
MARATALKLGFMNKPNPIVPQHTKPVAYLGGIGILGGLVAGVTYLVFAKGQWFIQVLALSSYEGAVLVGSMGFLILGIFDDLLTLRALSKFLWQVIVSIICVALGLKGNFTNLFVLDIILSLFWLLFIVNAGNLIDVCDGLLAGITVTAFFSIGICFPQLAPFSFIVAGSTLGFLIFNFPPASIFLGDAGSHLLGFLLAATGIMGSNIIQDIDGIVWMVLVVSIPVFELIFITTMRIFQKKRWWQGSSDHFSLRLQLRGLSKIQVDLISWTLNVVIVTVACLYPGCEIEQKVMVCLCVLMIFGMVWMILVKKANN